MTAPRRRTRTAIRFLALGATGLLVVGCGSSGVAENIPGGNTPGTVAASDTSSGESTADRGGGAPTSGGTLRYAVLTGPVCLDPQIASTFTEGGVSNQLVDRLTYQDPETGTISPWLATSWEVNDNATEYTFNLRLDATFSDGTPVDAEIVKKNYDLLGFGDEALGFPKSTTFAGYQGTEIVDEETIVVTFDVPAAGFLQATSIYRAGLVAESTLGKTAEERCQAENIVASGPFVLVSHTQDESTVYAKREGYAWGPEAAGHTGEAYLDGVELQVLPEASVRTGSLQSGVIDAANDIQPVDEELLTSQDFQIFALTLPGLGPTIQFRESTPFGSERAIRKAVQIGIDRQEVADTILSPSYLPATSLIGTRTPGYQDKSDALRYDPDTASKLLDDAGWTWDGTGLRSKDGVDLNIVVYAQGNVATYQPALELAQQQLARIGVGLDVNVVTATESAAAQDDLAVDAVFVNSSRADPDILRTTYGADGQNRAKLEEGNTLWPLLQQQASTPDQAERAQVVDDIVDWVLDESYGVPLYELPQVIGAAPNVHDIGFEATGRVWFYNTWIEP